ncbi:MAG: low specificity L-threonine aldolase [Muribaculaceae bacterium]|nr:low specificity L-threonine aldolase [Muribaculaceae bacterium]
MIYLDTDYMAGCHPEILEALSATNKLHTPGYGEEDFTRRARRLILEACGIPEGACYFMTGGTQTNATVIDRLLHRNDGVVAADSSHINVHEAGAVEAWGHKILTLQNQEGKISGSRIENYLRDFYADDTHEHMVRPGMVYISFPTELGTLYSKKELEEIYSVCRQFNIPLYIDGARLAYGLAAPDNDVTLKELAQLCDVFYIGGTKCGAMFGEAIVAREQVLLPRFVSLMKLHGGLLAKGRLLGVQFETLFSNELYGRIGKYGVDLASQLKEFLKSKGFKTFINSPTNQQFFIIPNQIIDKLKGKVSFELWGPPGKEESKVRFVTSWSTPSDLLPRITQIFKDL